MSHNKSARKMEERRDKLNKKYHPKPQSHSRHATPTVMGNMDYDAMNKLCQALGVTHSKIFCGYLHQPIDYSSSNNQITGNCYLGNDGYHKCTYKVPAEGDLCLTCRCYQDQFGITPPEAGNISSPLEESLD